MTDREMDQVAREIREWSRRPGRQTPEIARSRLLAELSDRRRTPTRWSLAFATAAVAALAIGLFVSGPEKPLSTNTATPDEKIAQAVLVYELGSGSKLYLDLESRR